MSIAVSHDERPRHTYIGDGTDRAAEETVTTRHGVQICLYADGMVASVFIDWDRGGFDANPADFTEASA